MLPLFVGMLCLMLVMGCAKTTQRSQTTIPKEGRQMMEISSPAFSRGEPIPAKYATEKVNGGQNLSIPYSWEGAPEDTQSFAFVLVDLAPVAQDWVHWLVVDIPPSVTRIAEGASGTSDMPGGARELDNTSGKAGYSGPQPPPQTGAHEYELRLYALDVAHLDLPQMSTLAQLEYAIKEHVLARAFYSGTFER